MNGEPTTESEGDKKSPTSVYARENAARDIRSGFGQSLDQALSSTGKVLAVLAGFGVFFVAAGYFVEWQRFRRGELPPEEVVPLLPREQIVAAGFRELAISVLFLALALGLLGFVLVKVAKSTDGRSFWLWRKVNAALSREAGFPTAVIAIFTLLLVPFDFFGLLVVVVVAGLLFYGLRLIREFLEAGDGAQFPLWRLVLAVALATFVLSVARQADFPERRPDAVVLLVNGDEVKGEYLASDSSKVLLREKAKSDGVQCELEKKECVVRCSGDPICIRECRLDRQRCDRPRLIVVPAGKVKEVHVTQSPWLLRQNSSLLDHIVDPFAPSFQFRCIPPECRWEGEVRIGLSSFL